MSSDSDKYSSLQEGPGIIFTSAYRLLELKQCLESACDSWVIKFEQILIHAAFLLGYVSPSRLIWTVIKQLIGNVINENGSLFNMVGSDDVRMGMSLLEQLGLTYIWDYVRDGSLCMRFNNCDNDFLAQLSNIKIKMCNSTDLMDDARKLSTCEKVFNDSPLILLATGMVLLALFSSSSKPSTLPPAPVVQDQPKPGSNENGNLPSSGNKTSKPLSLPSTSSSISRNGSTSNTFRTGFASPHFSFYVVGRSTAKAFPSNSLRTGFASPSFGFPSSINPSSSTSTSKKPTPYQEIHVECPNCKAKDIQKVPKPWPLCCAQVLPYAKKGGNIVTANVIKELFKTIKCKHCREQLQKKLQEIIHKEKEKKK